MKLLLLVHNDPRFHPGGTEIFCHELFRELGRRPGVAAVLVAGTSASQRARSPGTPFQTVAGSDDQMLLWTASFDVAMLSQTDTHGVVPAFAQLVREMQPDVVHFHHVLLLGVELLSVIRREAPRARIIMTLHDYYVICHRDGTMVRTAASGAENALCAEASPDRCHACFPDTPAMDFKLRELYVQRHLALVNRFISPSRFLAERMIAWGLPSERIAILPNGRQLPPAAPLRSVEQRRRRTTFALLGNQSPLKGTLVALEAARLAAAAASKPFALTLHGAPQFQTEAFRDRVTELAGRVNALDCGASVLTAGPYATADVPRLIADADWVIVPSIWWENAPLVIQEAFHHRRPVLCSDIGGMAEAVRHGTTGLRFRVGDPRALADCMLQALDDTLWQRMSDAIAPVVSIEACADAHLAVYRGEGAPAGALRADAAGPHAAAVPA